MNTSPEQIFEPIPVSMLVPKIQALRQEGFRLVQISATRLPEHIEMTYTFDGGQALVNLRLRLPAGEARVPSITSVYWCAFLYENEIHDLFNVLIDGMAVDFHGEFYRTDVKYAFGSPKAPTPLKPPPPSLN